MEEKGQAKVLLSDLKVLSLQAKWSSVVDTWHSWKSSKVICGPDIWSHRSWIFNNFLKFTFFYFQTLSDAIGSFFSGSSGNKDKGSLISESFSLWLNAQGITLLHTFFFFGDLSQSEEVSEIELPLQNPRHLPKSSLANQCHTIFQ